MENLKFNRRDNSTVTLTSQTATVRIDTASAQESTKVADFILGKSREFEALVAVADAASVMFNGSGLQDYHRSTLAQLLANLAAVRSGKNKISPAS